MEALLYKYVLALTIVMPGNTPDLQKMIPMKSLEECWQTAQAFVQAEDIGKKKRTPGVTDWASRFKKHVYLTITSGIHMKSKSM